MNKNDLQNLDVKNQTQKRRMCIGIAKFYVKIAHIYAAIVTTIKPNYSYTEASSGPATAPATAPAIGPAPAPAPAPAMGGSLAPAVGPGPGPASGPGPGSASAMASAPVQQVDLAQKQLIPADAKVNVKINNICSQRLNALLNNQDMSGETIIVKPNVCKMNLDITTNKTRNLASEPGMPELSKLYYDNYDYDQGGFTGMTTKMRTEVYEEDVKKFYKMFTGESTVPPEVKTFSDIPLKAYHASKGCAANGPYLGVYKGTVKDRLFNTYAEHVKQMMKTSEDNQNKLLVQIDKLFVFDVNPITKEREITLREGLTEAGLQKIVEDTRNLIVNLYITCEKDFLTGLEIFEAIVEKQIMDTSKVQMVELQKIIDNKLANSDLSEMAQAPVTAVPAAPVPAAPVPIKAPMPVQAPAPFQAPAPMPVQAPAPFQAPAPVPVPISLAPAQAPAPAQ